MTESVTIAQRKVERVILQRGAPPQMVVGAERTRVVISYRGVPGLAGEGLDSYEHLQPSAASIWTVNHNLGRKPAAVSVRSPGGVEVTAAVLHVSVNQLQISFAAPASGSALVQ